MEKRQVTYTDAITTEVKTKDVFVDVITETKEVVYTVGGLESEITQLTCTRDGLTNKIIELQGKLAEINLSLSK